MWSVIEVNTGIICASVPILKPLATRIFPTWIMGSENASGQASSHPRHLLPKTEESGANSWPGKSSPRSSTSHRGSYSTATWHSYDPTGAGPDKMRLTEDRVEKLSTAPDSQTPAEASVSGSRAHHPAFFDFVNFTGPASMLMLNNRESIPPVAMTTILFFLWGFSYGLLDVLNIQFNGIGSPPPWVFIGLHGAFYGGYLIGPLTIGRFVLTTWGFKSTFITGLCIYACGTLIYWPSAVLMSCPVFYVANLVTGLGLATLETAADPFIALCGPLENSEVRLNFAQGVQAVGAVVSMLLAKKVLFKHVSNALGMVDVQWAYLSIALFDVLLAVVFHYLPIPEASDDELRELADLRRTENAARVGGIRVVWLTFALGVFSQWCFVGGQEALAATFENLVTALTPE
jgi:hypothetical protein